VGNLNFLIEQVSKEKGFDKEIIIDALKEAMIKAAQRRYNVENASSIEAIYIETEGEIELFQFKTVVEVVETPDYQIDLEEARKLDPAAELGDELGVKLEVGEFGRIAAQVAKQIIVNKMRNAERELVYNDYKDRKGDIIAGTVRRIERGNIIVDLGRAEGMLPAKEQSSRENYRVRDRILCYVKEVSRTARGPQIILSRTDEGLLIKLFEMEVPEIAEGIVIIVSAAREAGSRSKIAVTSRDSDVDPVGACVGMKGTRVQNIVQEMRGEKIDIVPWNPDPVKFVCNSLAPAVVSQVVVDDEEKVMEITVPDDQLSLAIGKKGQNVRLAAQLTGWKLDIQSESKVEKLAEIARDLFTKIRGVNEELAMTLTRLGFMSLEDIYTTEMDDLRIIPGLNEELAKDLINNARRLADEQVMALDRHKQEIERRKQKQREKQAELSKSEIANHELGRIRLIDEQILARLLARGFTSLLDIAKVKDPDKLADELGFARRKARRMVHLAKQKLPKVHPELFEDGAPPAGVDMPWYTPDMLPHPAEHPAEQKPAEPTLDSVFGPKKEEPQPE